MVVRIDRLASVEANLLERPCREARWVKTAEQGSRSFGRTTLLPGDPARPEDILLDTRPRRPDYLGNPCQAHGLIVARFIALNLLLPDAQLCGQLLPAQACSNSPLN